MPHKCRKVWQHNSQVVSSQNPIFKAFDCKSVAKAVNSWAYSRVGDVSHNSIRVLTKRQSEFAEKINELDLNIPDYKIVHIDNIIIDE